MRLQGVENGEGFGNRLLIRLISSVSGMRLPDAARMVMYHQDFYGKPMTSWTHAAMRGESSWSVGERELIAAMVAQWNTCPFCVSAHSSIAALELGESLVRSALVDLEKAEISKKMQVMLAFLKKLTQTPNDLIDEDVRVVLNNNITHQNIEDAIAVAVLFSITVRCANAFNFELLNEEDSAKAAKRMLKQGYVFGKTKLQGHPDHRSMAEVLEKRVLQGPGSTDAELRQAIADRTNGGAPLETPYEELALQMGEGGYRVTEELIKKVVAKSGGEKAAFELITTAAVSAGIYRWKKGLGILAK